MGDGMTILFPYLDRELRLDVPDSNLLACVEPNEVPSVADGAALVRRVCSAPLDSSPLGDFLVGAQRLLVIVNDATRPTPTPTMLDALADELEAHGARFLVATGAHRAPTEEEYRQILGAHYGRFRGRIEAHDARNRESLVDLGVTRNGTPILLNRALIEADRVIATGSVEPHYFAGYTGGRKAFFPGVAGYETVEANHRLALDPRARALALEDNPVSQDMDDALTLVPGRVFAVMAVLDKHQRLAACYAGDIRSSFREAVATANAIFTVALPERADIVISLARHPMDIDLYQAQKAIDNASLALKPGGLLILVASCRDGVGDRAYIELLGSSSSPAEARSRIASGYRLGYHKAAKIAQVASNGSIWAVSELDEATLGKAFITKKASLEAAFSEAMAMKGPTANVVVLLDGTVTVPLVRA
ncbi:MAG TPA: nickel-dependent lactate racemase [Rectinemataceae bacterium]|nr:nickel-dependent lactate racemase [Rectinemataceae bacterium]